MPTNLEFKASIHSVEDVKLILKKINAVHLETIKQLDTYYYTQFGRLKIREINGSIYQLIFYKRDEIDKFRVSEYQICEFSEIQKLKEVFAKSLGISGIVNKTREVYMFKNCRIHIDDVANLGKFIEFECIQESDVEKCFELVNYLYSIISPNIVQIHRNSYIDMLS